MNRTLLHPRILVLALCIVLAARARAEPSTRPAADDRSPRVVFRPARGAIDDLPNDIRDPGFEWVGTTQSDWRPYGEGFEVDPSVHRGGRRSIRCRGFDATTTFGAATRITFPRPESRAVLLETWTRAAGVDTAPSPEYSLYADLTYADGSREWARYACCPTGTHDWQRVELVLRPARPLASIDLYCLFRNTPGSVWFDDVACRVIDAARVREFDGEFVVAVAPLASPAAGEQSSHRTDARPANRADEPVLLIQAHDDSGEIYHVPLSPAQDQGRPAPRWRFELRALDLSGAVEFRDAGGGSRRIDVSLSSRRDAMRPLTLYVARRFEAEGAFWWHDGVRREAIAPGGRYADLEWAGGGKTGWMSRYPLAVVDSPRGSLAFWQPAEGGIAAPEIMRLGFDADAGLFYAAFDVVLRPPAKRIVTVAERHWARAAGFREACAELRWNTDPWPSDRPLGLWLPFAKASRIERPEDFGFAFKEGTDDQDFDEAHGLLTFRYTEPQSFWLRMDPDGPRDYAACVAALERAAADVNHPQHREAKAAWSSACRTADGRLHVWPQKKPWCDGAVFALNPSPRLDAPLTRARLNYDAAGASRYRASGVDGEYWDSLDGWADVLNFNAAHIRRAEYLSFDPLTRRPCVLNAHSIYEFCRDFEDRSTRSTFLTMANFCPTRYWWMAGLVDVMGQEVNWKPDGRWSPMSHEDLWRRRALCGKRPYGLLMNSDFDGWTADDSRRYMLLCAAYGFFPGFFSHDAATRQYFETPALYNRDRPLFRTFIPVIRDLARAGWEPRTRARVVPDWVLVERFAGGGREFWTVHNPTDAAVTARVWLPRDAPGAATMVAERITGQSLVGRIEGGEICIDLSLGAEDTKVLSMAGPTTAPAAVHP